jgi:hypothetical protein
VARKTNSETVVEFLPRPRQRDPLLDHRLRPGPAKPDHFIAGVNILSAIACSRQWGMCKLLSGGGGDVWIGLLYLCSSACFLSARLLKQSPRRPPRRVNGSTPHGSRAPWTACKRSKVGMSRSDLVRLFTTEGGLSTTSRRTYVYRRCLYIKVDVKFAASSRDGELPTDKIVAVSRPHLAWSVMD